MTALAPFERFRWSAPAPILAAPHQAAPHGGAAGFLARPDGAKLRVGVFWPPEPSRASVLVMTGYTEFLEKYFETIRDLQAQQFAVVLMEWRGHGLSARALTDAPARFHLRDLDDAAADLDALWDGVMQHMPRPHFGLAHSMGGQIALKAAHRNSARFAALSLSAPMLGLPAPAWGQRTLEAWAAAWRLMGLDTRPLVGSAPSRQAGKMAENTVTTDAVRFARNEEWMQMHPSLMVNQVSLGFVRAALRAMRASARPSFLQAVTTPILLGMAEEEQIVSNASIVRAAAQLPQAQLIRYRGARHEILMERDEIRSAFLSDSLAWFHKHAPRRRA